MARETSKEILFEAVAAEVYRTYGREEKPASVVIKTRNGLRIGIDVPFESSGPGEATVPGPDFRTVLFRGKSLSFTATQAAIVRLLWDAHTAGTPDIGQETLLEAAGSTGNRLRDLFRRDGGRLHPAWTTLIVTGHVKGTFRLDLD